MAKKLTDNEDVVTMSDSDLMKEWTALGKQVQSDKERLRAFSQEHQKRERLKQLNLTPGDLDLLQDTSPEYIESQEAVN